MSEQDIWTGVVQKGVIVRDIPASGSLVAPDIRAVTNFNSGIVENVMVVPGDRVEAGDLLVEMTNPQLLADRDSCRWELRAMEEELDAKEVEYESSRLDVRAQVAAAESEYMGALLELQAREELIESQVYSQIDLERLRLRVDQLKFRLDAEQERLRRLPELHASRRRIDQARLSRQREKLEQLNSYVSLLDIRSKTSGIVKDVNTSEGVQLPAGQPVIRILNPNNLVARLRVPEQDAAMVVPDLTVDIEAGRESLTGRIIRVNPTAEDRHISVDVELDLESNPSIRPNQTVIGRIEVDRITQALFIPRPAGLVRANQETNLFRVNSDETRAEQLRVLIGALTADKAQILHGLEEGDRVIIADMADYLDYPVLRIRS